jgi:ferritin-like metal-binding protein YciE
MSATIARHELTSYLSDAHSIEEQALQQLRPAPKVAGDPLIASVFEQHIPETEWHEKAVRERLERLGGSPSTLKDVVMRAGGVAFVLFAQAQPDTPGKLVAHAYSYEHLEEAAYELLARTAERADDPETAAVARRIADDERTMSERLAGVFDRATERSLEAVGRERISEQLIKYLTDAHAIEMQGIELLQRGPKVMKDEQLARVLSDHLVESRQHEQTIRGLLEKRGASPSLLKDAAMRLGGLNWTAFFAAHPDTPGKLIAFAYAFEHLEIAGYEELRRVADAAGDLEASREIELILAEERLAATRLKATFDRAVDASLEAKSSA